MNSKSDTSSDYTNKIYGLLGRLTEISTHRPFGTFTRGNFADFNCVLAGGRFTLFLRQRYAGGRERSR